MKTQDESVDVLVVGGGPAGSVVALCLARRGLSVRLIEASTYNTPRYGETLPPEINPLLRQLSLWNAFEDLGPLPAHGIISVWGDARPTETDFIRNVHGHGWHVDRCAFDRMLVLEAQNAGVHITLGQKAEVQRTADGMWHVGHCQARSLVDATGRNGLRVQGDARRRTEDTLLAIALTLELSGQRKDWSTWTTIEAAPDGWWYTAPLPRSRGIAMFFTDPSIYQEDGVILNQQLEHAPLAAQRLALGRVNTSRVLRISSSSRHTMCGDQFLAVGDSAVSMDPLSGRGVFHALRWADPAAEAMLGSLRGDRNALAGFAHVMERQYRDYSRQRQRYYAGEQRWAERTFWRERQRAMPG